MTPRQRAELITKELEAEGDKLWHPRLFYDDTADAIEQAITAAVEEEREACAKIADAESDAETGGSTYQWSHAAEQIAEIIRARSTTAE